MKKTIESLEYELKLRDTIDVERKLNKILFAEKRVEVLLYGLIGLVLTAFIGAIVKLVFLS